MTADSVIERHDMANKRASRPIAYNILARLQGMVRLFVYLLIALAVLAVDAALIHLVYLVIAQSSASTAGLVTYFTTALAAITFLPLYARMRALADTALYHDNYDLSVELQHYSQHFGALSDQDGITSFLLDSLQQTLNLVAIAYVALPEGLDASVMKVLEAGDIRARGRYATTEGKTRLLRGLAYLPDGAESLLRQKKLLRNPWRECEALVLIESVSGGSIAGLLVVGSKRVGGYLQRKDRMLLETVAHVVGTAYANALLIQGLHVSLVQVQTSTNQLRATRAELQLLLRELVSAEERERAALARDLHDDALQEVLYVIRHAQYCTRLAGELEASWRGDSQQLHLLHPTTVPTLASHEFAATPERGPASSVQRLREELSQLADRSQVLEQKLRALCMGLYPEALRVLGLPTALEEFAGQLVRTTGMDVSVYYDDDTARAAESLLPERSVHLFRIAQEALTNASKHASSTSCMVYLTLLAMFPDSALKNPERDSQTLWLCLTIIDNGVGLRLPLDMGALVRSGHLGMAGMRERAEQLEGRLDIRRDPSGGTRIMIMSPVTETALSRLAANQPAKWRITGN
jgi:signal transduction histidine kinase